MRLKYNLQKYTVTVWTLLHIKIINTSFYIIVEPLCGMKNLGVLPWV